jgi:hypothetical protein
VAACSARCALIFSANVRYTGITLGYQLGAALAGYRAADCHRPAGKIRRRLGAGGLVSCRHGDHFFNRDFLRQPR